MTAQEAKAIIENFNQEDLKEVIVDDWDSYSMDILFRTKPNLNRKEKMAVVSSVKKFFKTTFGYKLTLRFDDDYQGYWVEFPYAEYSVKEPEDNDFEDTLIFSKKAYQDDKKFAEIVLETANQARSKEHHMELIEKRLPNGYTIEPLWTYEHGSMRIDRFQRCVWDSSADAFCAYKDEAKLEAKLEAINDGLC